MQIYKTNSQFSGPGIPSLASAAERNWALECTGPYLDQDCRQDNEQRPLQQPAMDKESETRVITQL